MVEKEMQEREKQDCGGSSSCQPNGEKRDKSLWYVAGFVLALILLALILTII